MLKHTLRYTLALVFITFTQVISAELPRYISDPLGTAGSSQMPADSSSLLRLRLADELNTGAPPMPEPATDLWWDSFNDPVLRRLIALASANNADLHSIIQSVRASRYALQAVNAGYFPSLSAAAMYQKGQNSGALAHGRTTQPLHDNYMGLSLELNWEIDLFGRIGKQKEIAGAAYNVSRVQYVGALVSLCSQVAEVYFDFAAARAMHSTAISHLKSQQKILDITDARLQAGISSKLDVSQATTVVLNTRSTIPALQARIDADIDMLALLTCTGRETIAAALTDASLPDASADMIPLVSDELMRRRPDVAEAEYNLASAAARAGLAKKDWLPTLTLSASAGTESHSAKNLFSRNSFSYSLTPTLAWTVFDGQRRKYTIAEAKESVLAAADSYDYTVASARYEVASAKSRYMNLLDEISILRQAALQSRESLDLSLELYKSGLTDFSNVVDAQMSWLNYENAVISARNDAAASLTTLYRALGGGWDGSLPEPVK